MAHSRPARIEQSTEPPIRLNCDPSSDSRQQHEIIDDYAIQRVDFHVARLGRVLRLSHHRKEDLRQDLLVALCEAADRYDKRKSSPRTFVSRVLCLAAAHHARGIRNERRNAARSPIRLSELQREGRCFTPIAPRGYEPTTCDLAIDLTDHISRLSREQQQLAADLKTLLPREIAAERHMHRGTVYRNIATMRAALADSGLDPRE